MNANHCDTEQPCEDCPQCLGGPTLPERRDGATCPCMDCLQTPAEWSAELGVIVRDPDGWRRDGKPWDEPIGRAEFERRLSTSTAEHRIRPSEAP